VYKKYKSREDWSKRKVDRFYHILLDPNEPGTVNSKLFKIIIQYYTKRNNNHYK